MKIKDVTFLAFTVIAVAVLVIVGWVFNIGFLKSILPI